MSMTDGQIKIFIFQFLSLILQYIKSIGYVVRSMYYTVPIIKCSKIYSSVCSQQAVCKQKYLTCLFKDRAVLNSLLLPQQEHTCEIFKVSSIK